MVRPWSRSNTQSPNRSGPLRLLRFLFGPKISSAPESPPEAPNFRELRAVERELATALAEITSLNELLEDIPEIFERKFQQRLQPLLAENQALRHQVLQLQSSPTDFRAAELLPSVQSGRGQRPRFGQVIRHAFGLKNAA